MALNESQRSPLVRGWRDPSRVLFPKQSRDVRALLVGIPDSTSEEYYYLMLQAVREDLAQTLARKPHAGFLGLLKLTVLCRIKLMRLRTLQSLAAAHVTEIQLRETVFRR